MRNPKSFYEVVVGNLGNIYEGGNKAEAMRVYREYVRMSKSGRGRAGGEDVSLWKNSHPILEHYGHLGDGYESNPKRSVAKRTAPRKTVKRNPLPSDPKYTISSSSGGYLGSAYKYSDALKLAKRMVEQTGYVIYIKGGARVHKVRPTGTNRSKKRTVAEWTAERNPSIRTSGGSTGDLVGHAGTIVAARKKAQGIANKTRRNVWIKGGGHKIMVRPTVSAKNPTSKNPYAVWIWVSPRGSTYIGAPPKGRTVDDKQKVYGSQLTHRVAVETHAGWKIMTPTEAKELGYKKTKRFPGIR